MRVAPDDVRGMYVLGNHVRDILATAMDQAGDVRARQALEAMLTGDDNDFENAIRAALSELNAP
jgi:hypothetical protein